MCRCTFYVKNCGDCPYAKWNSGEEYILCFKVGSVICYDERDMPADVLKNCPFEIVDEFDSDQKPEASVSFVTKRPKRQIDL